jgi:hypothetical protein
MSIQLWLPPVAVAQNGRIWTALVLTGTQPAPNQIGGTVRVLPEVLYH